MTEKNKEQDQFDPKKDAARLAEANVLETYLTANLEPTVLALDAPWGYGKTWFLTRFQRMLWDKGVICIYYSAWEADFADNPLASFLTELDECCMKIEKNHNIQDEVKKETAIAAGKEVTKFISTLVTRFAIRKITSSEEFEDLVEDMGLERLTDPKEIKEAALRMKEKLSKPQPAELTFYKHQRKIRKQFKAKLEEFAACMRQAMGNESPVIIIIDELDRCRPNYAIELLEQIKHLLSVKGVSFVLGMHRNELGKSVRVLYGHDFDGQEYLRRFIDIDYHLAPLNGESFISQQLSDNFLELCKRHTGVTAWSNKHTNFHCYMRSLPVDLFLNGEVNIRSGLSQTLHNLFSAFKIGGLRTQMQYLQHLEIVLRLIPGELFFSFKVIALLVVLRSEDKERYQGLAGRGRLLDHDDLALPLPFSHILKGLYLARKNPAKPGKPLNLEEAGRNIDIIGTIIDAQPKVLVNQPQPVSVFDYIDLIDGAFVKKTP